METHVWQALPPRKKCRAQKSVVAVDDLIDPGIAKEDDKSCAVQHQQTIIENIEARSALQRANATLESKDGCKGEFYECM
jgi:hypothetical protein